MNRLGDDRPTEMTVPVSAIESVDANGGPSTDMMMRKWCCLDCDVDKNGSAVCSKCGNYC